MSDTCPSTYAVGTWDAEAQAFTPQAGLRMPWYGLTAGQLRAALKRLRIMGYTASRWRCSDGEHDSDPMVLVEAVDGRLEAEVLEDWKR